MTTKKPAGAKALAFQPGGGTHLLFAHPDYNFLLRIKATAAQRMDVVSMLRQHATTILAKAVARIPVEKPAIVAAYRAKGIEPVWVLSDNADARRFCAMLPDFNPTPAELEAVELLRACMHAEEIGDVPEFRLMSTGQKFVNGRAPETLSPVARKIKAYLTKNPSAKAAEVWNALKNAPPKGLDFRESTRLGRYIERGREPVMEWRRFQNLVSDHRPKKG